MNELIELVVKKTGLPKETAKQAVEVVLNFLKEKLPAPLASQLDAVIENSGALTGVLDDGKIDANDAANLLGGLFGGKK